MSKAERSYVILSRGPPCAALCVNTLITLKTNSFLRENCEYLARNIMHACTPRSHSVTSHVPLAHEVDGVSQNLRQRFACHGSFFFLLQMVSVTPEYCEQSFLAVLVIYAVCNRQQKRLAFVGTFAFALSSQILCNRNAGVVQRTRIQNSFFEKFALKSQ